MGTGALTGIFSSYIEVATKAGCSVIAMDSRGHGASVMKMAALKVQLY